MPHRQVPLRAGSYYHVYNRGVARQQIFNERENYLYFLRQLREYLLDDPAKADVLAYCLMPNHFHLLVRLLTDDFARAMQSLGQSYSKAIKIRFGRVGPLFAGRYQAKHVDDDSYLLLLSRYIHLNPVAAGIVAQPEEWEFSSYREYVGSRAGTLPKVNFVLSMFGTGEKYRDFVLEGIGSRDNKIQHLLFDET